MDESGHTYDGSCERRSADRRSKHRRAPRMRLDPLFAATIVNQINPVAQETVLHRYKDPKAGPRRGLFVNLRV